MGIFQTIAAAFSPRQTVEALHDSGGGILPPYDDFTDSIVPSRARDRMLEHFSREPTPREAKDIMDAIVSGDLKAQTLMISAMLDSWPKLQKNITEVARLVSVAPWKVHPYSRRGEGIDPKSEKLAREVEDMIWRMKPRATHSENGFEGTLKALVRGYYYGHNVAEILWTRDKDGTLRPRCTKTIPARCYGYPYDFTTGPEGEDRLMLDKDGGQYGFHKFTDFDEHKFLIAINRGHEGHASVAAPLRALVGYWFAATYGLKWFLNYTQIYGVPWRHAEVAEPKDERAVKEALASIGTNGYIVTKAGTKINMLDAGKGGDLPQKALIELADQQCDQFILGQTLTSGTANSGSRALGEVHQGTLHGVIDGLCDFVGEILTHQLVPSIVALNWGTSREDLPQIWAKREVIKDEKALAERDEKLGITSGKTPVARSWYYERHGIPMPAEGDELLIAAPELPTLPVKLPLPMVKAADAEPEATNKESLTVDQLSNAVLEGLTGVAADWLAPVRSKFERLAALAMAKTVTDEDFIAALETAQKEMPELFDLLDTETLQIAFEEAIATAALAGGSEGPDA